LASVATLGKVRAMRTILFASLVALATTAGCSKSSDATPSTATAPAAAEVPTVTPDDLEKSIASGQVTAVDANGEQTRKKMGVVPGAVLLTDSDSFAASELPSDKSKQLVFYCGNEECGASHHAAGKAIAAGYKNVKVMPAGIAGWVKAGKKTSQI
jgi:rhodanese-related sulfurtransferase